MNADNEWSEASEIGCVFEGKVFTVDEYIAFEDALIEIILSFFDASSLPHLRVSVAPDIADMYGEEFFEHKTKYPQLFLPAFQPEIIVDDKIVRRDDIVTVARMVLRQFSYCRLELLDSFYLHFGDGSYVYISTENSPTSLPPVKGIFVEETEGPSCHMGRGDIEVLVDKYDPSKGYVTESFLTILGHLSRIQLRDILGEHSKEHPFVTHFSLTPEMAKKLRPYTNYSFDFEQFEYKISTYGNEF